LIRSIRNFFCWSSVTGSVRFADCPGIEDHRLFALRE
jgi:hypothetical protein